MDLVKNLVNKIKGEEKNHDKDTEEVNEGSNKGKKAKSVYQLDEVELKDLANSSCTKCYGRGFTGWNKTYQVYEVCPCVQKAHTRKQL